MTRSPISKVLSTIRERGVQSLLMGGQACIIYGAAEFSRDADLTVFATNDNFQRLEQALADLVAEVVAVPPFEPGYLERGHAVHFRCRRADVTGARLDIMTTMRGVDPFPALWERRTTVTLSGDLVLELLSLPDLVASKKTQRDKDWLMVRRLGEANYAQFFDDANDERIRFWLRELRTPTLLVECASRFPVYAEEVAEERPAVRSARTGDEEATLRELHVEEARERQFDRAYWAPLRRELEELRRQRRRRG